MKIFFLLISMCLASGSARAGVLGLFGYAQDARHGGEMALGAALHVTERTTIDLYPADFVFFMKDAPSRYREETFQNGTMVCRDLSNGEFAKKSNCKPIVDLEYTPSIAITRPITDRLRLGIGYRVGDAAGTFGTAEIALPQGFNLYLRGGSRQLGIALVMRP